MHFESLFKSGSETRKRASFIQSGYNTLGQTIRQSDEDIFFFDLKLDSRPVPASRTEIFQRVLQDLDWSCRPLLLDDHSLAFGFLKNLIQEAGFPFEAIAWDALTENDPKLAQFCFEERNLDSALLFHLVQLASIHRRPLLCPQYFFKIVNSTTGSNNPPYWVYVENERYHIFDQICVTLGLDVLWNWYRCHPDFYHYQFSSDIEKILENRTDAKDLDSFEMKTPSPISEQQTRQGMKHFKVMAQSAYPWHQVMKLQGRDSRLNSAYRRLYGD